MLPADQRHYRLQAVVICLVVLCLKDGLIQADDTNALSADDKDYLVQLHNDARDLEAAKDMNHVVWDDALAQSAQDWTDGCTFKHQTGKSWGENLSASTKTASRSSEDALKAMFDLWTKEKQYNPGGTFEECCSQASAKCCHYTQVIWSKSTKVGCGQTYCSTVNSNFGTMTNMLYLACYYSPKGNKPQMEYIFDWRPYMPIEE